MKLGHVHLKVSNLKRAENFYQELLGLQITERIENLFSFLSFGQAHHDLALQQISSTSSVSNPELSVGLYHVAYEVDTEAEFSAAINKLIEMNCGYSKVDHQISWAVYTSDPDDNGVEIFLDRRKAKGGSDLWNGRSSRLA